MRYSPGHKQAVRQNVVLAASKALRRQGLTGVSIPALMRKVGLTHGGFYAHFRNRDELVAEAVRSAAEETAARVLTGGEGGLRAVLDAYLSLEHVEHPADGCVVAALGSEARQQRAPVRRAFSSAARGLLEHLQRKVHPGGASPQISDVTLALAARMVGAVVLARLVDDRALAGRILEAVKRS